MKIIPYATVSCAAALIGLSLVVSTHAASEPDKVPDSALKKYDANQDGKLDDAERAAWQADKEKQRSAREARRAEDLQKYDADKDGKLDREERAALKADQAKARADKQAAVAARKAEKAAAAEAKKLAKYDKDRDGKLNDEEAAALKADKEKSRAAAEKRKATLAAKEKALEGEPVADER